MAGGWSKDGAVQEQIDASINDAVEQARSKMPKGESLEFCDECEAPIPEERRIAVPGVQFCSQCQSEIESKQKAVELFNRRGSKDSQLR